jgi:CRISPR/Cas system-associated exonuclease Cas4 (RecB family)
MGCMIDFNKMVDRHIEREHKPKQIGRYYPSEIGGCSRKIWYSYTHPLQVSSELLKIFEVGNIMHGFVVEVLKNEKNKEIQLLQSEFPFQLKLDDFVVSGRIDDLIEIKEEKKSILVEVKSTKSIDFLQKPQSSHESQLLFYMHALGIHEGIVLYIDKNNLQSKVFPVEYSPKKAEEIILRFSSLNEALKKNILPLPEARMNNEMSWACNYCEYCEKCEKDEK